MSNNIDFSLSDSVDDAEVYEISSQSGDNKVVTFHYIGHQVPNHHLIVKGYINISSRKDEGVDHLQHI